MAEQIVTMVVNGKVMVSSREVASKFEKVHRDVLKALDNLKAGLEFNGEFYLRNYTPIQPAHGKRISASEILMTKDGFMLLAMGFNGPKAMAWKIKFIDTFNRLVEAVASGPKPGPAPRSRRFTIENPYLLSLQLPQMFNYTRKMQMTEVQEKIREEISNQMPIIKSCHMFLDYLTYLIELPISKSGEFNVDRTRAEMITGIPSELQSVILKDLIELGQMVITREYEPGVRRRTYSWVSPSTKSDNWNKSVTCA
jgi:Rha family phage regulatory protein